MPAKPPPDLDRPVRRPGAGRRLRHVAAAVAGVFALAQGRAFALEGRVVDAATGAAIVDASVILDGREARTDRNGGFAFPEGGAVAARAPGYRALRVSAEDLARSAGRVELRPFKPKALYLTVYGVGSPKLKQGALDLIRRGSANALVIDMKGDRGLVPYPSAVAPAFAPGSRRLTTVPDLPALVQELHAQGVYLIARIVVFKDDPLAQARPDLAVKRQGGQPFRDREGLAWVDPFRSEVAAYDIGLAVEAAKAGFDEVQFDYLRFPDSSAALQFARPSTPEARTEAIAGFLKEARLRLAPYNVFLAADIFGYVCWNQGDIGIGQKLEDVAPNVDYLSPMLYPSGFQYGIPGLRNPVSNPYEIIRNSLNEARARLNISPLRFRPWLQAFQDYAFDRRIFDAREISEQIRAADDFGSDGWMLWNARNTYPDLGAVGPDRRRPLTVPAAWSPSEFHACP